jgi:hypothetical protein
LLQVLVEGRLSQALNLVWEKMGEAEVVAAVTNAAAEVLPGGPSALHEWATREQVHSGGSERVGHYVVYWELARTGNYTAGQAPAQADVAARAAAMDAAFQAVSPIFKGERGGRIGGTQLKVVAPGAFETVR